MEYRGYFLLFVALSVLTCQCATIQRHAISCGSIEIISDELSVHESESYCRYAESERQKVNRFWGATWNEPIRIHVSSSYRISRALVPAYQGNRGVLEMPLRRVRSNDGALLHEIVHIYAPMTIASLPKGWRSICMTSWPAIPPSQILPSHLSTLHVRGSPESIPLKD